MASYREKAIAAMLEKVRAKDLCDDRNVYFGSNASKLPNGEFGMVLLSLKGNDLLISDLDIRSNPGDLLYTVSLAAVSDFKIGFGLVGNTLKFTFDGQKYAFKNIVGLKPQLEAIRAEAAK